MTTTTFPLFPSSPAAPPAGLADRRELTPAEREAVRRASTRRRRDGALVFGLIALLLGSVTMALAIEPVPPHVAVASP